MSMPTSAPTAPAITLPATSSPPGPRLSLPEILGNWRRLWLRGRLLLPASGVVPTSWWRPWGWAWSSPSAPTSVRLGVEVSGQNLTAEVPLLADGSFEALLESDTPADKGCWRVAGVRAEAVGHTARATAVILQPAAAEVLIVLLPPRFTRSRDGARELASWTYARRLTALFDRLRQRGRGGALPPPSPWRPRAFYYIADVGRGADGVQAELALAVATLGWPAGHFALLSAGGDGVGGLLIGLERLRWLLADQGSLQVVNLEPAAAAALNAWRRLQAPAAVRRLVHVGAKLRAGVSPSRVATLPSERRLDRVGLPWVGRRSRHARRAPRYPVVICHGMLIICQLRGETPEHLNYFSTLGDALRRRGVRVLFPQVAPSHGVLTRARQLREQILAWTDEPVNLVCHSLGGLDARHLVTHLGMAERVKSVTTLSTPHHGSHAAEWVCASYQDSLPLLHTLETLGLSMDAIRDCQPAACRAFNAATPDAPGVRYFSYGAAVPQSRVSPMLRRLWNVLTATEGPNDGLVSVESARWGESLGTLAVDHFAQSPDGMYIHPRENFDSKGFFVRLLEDLAWRGF